MPWTRVCVLRLRGPLRAPANARLGVEIVDLLRRGERRVVLDLAGISGLDAAGVGELVRAYNLMRTADGELRIVRIPGRMRDLLERVRLSSLLNGEVAHCASRDGRSA